MRRHSLSAIQPASKWPCASCTGYSGLPIYVTEHGCSASDEAFRERDLKDNLAAMHRAIEGGVDVRGFYYWSLLDNFEWQFGYTKKFGLLAVDFSDKSLPRKMKPLAEIYRKVCLENSLANGASNARSIP